MLITKDLTKKKQEIEIKVRHYKANITKLIKQSKAKHFNNLFLENKLNLLCYWIFSQYSKTG